MATVAWLFHSIRFKGFLQLLHAGTMTVGFPHVANLIINGMTNRNPSRTRWKIALGVVVLFVAAVGWLVAWPAYQRHRVIQEIERIGGWAERGIAAGREPGGPQWLRQWGIDSDRDVEINLADTQINDEWLKKLSRLPNMRFLYLDNTKISDAGLEHLGRLTRLEQLSLNGTAVSDEGLKHLCRLKRLYYLRLEDTQVTDASVKMLQESLPKCDVEYHKRF